MTRLARSILGHLYEAAQVSDFDVAIQLHQAALSLRTAPHDRRLASLHGLALAYVARFHRTGRLQDLHDAISLLREALDLLHVLRSDRFRLLNDLAAALLTRFGKMKDSLDLREAKALCGEARGSDLGESGSTTPTTGDNHEPQLDVCTYYGQIL